MIRLRTSSLVYAEMLQFVPWKCCKQLSNKIILATNFFAGLEGGELLSLEDEISHLQKENSRIESQLSRMKGDITGAESEASSDDKVLKQFFSYIRVVTDTMKIGSHFKNDLFTFLTPLPLNLINAYRLTVKMQTFSLFN